MNDSPCSSPPSRLRWILRLTAPAALLLLLGCAKNESMTMSPGAVAELSNDESLPAAQTVNITGSAGDRGGGEYNFSDDLDVPAEETERFARTELAATPSSSRARQSFQTSGPPARTSKDKDKIKADEKAKEAARGGDAAEGGQAKEDDTPAHGRQIIYTAGLQISVFDLEVGMKAVESLPDRWGGWIHMRSQNQVVLRLPAHNLKPAMSELSELGVVEARTLQAQDVTAEYVDLESRISVLRETQTQLLELLAKAKTVEEALHVRKALDDVTMELEVALGRMRQLGDLIAFSTLTVSLIERGPQHITPSSNDPFRWVDELGVEATEWR